MKSREQKPFTVFHTTKIVVVYSVTALGAAIRFMKQTGKVAESVLPGMMIH